MPSTTLASLLGLPPALTQGNQTGGVADPPILPQPRPGSRRPLQLLLAALSPRPSRSAPAPAPARAPVAPPLPPPRGLAPPPTPPPYHSQAGPAPRPRLAPPPRHSPAPYRGRPRPTASPFLDRPRPPFPLAVAVAVVAAREREGAGIPHSWELGECGPGRAGGGRGSGPGELAGSGPALGELGEPFTRFPERGAPQGRPEKGVSGGRLWGGMREGWGRLSARARTAQEEEGVCGGPGSGRGGSCTERLGGPFGRGAREGEPWGPWRRDGRSEGCSRKGEPGSCHGFLTVWPRRPRGLGAVHTVPPGRARGSVRTGIPPEALPHPSPSPHSLGHCWLIGTQSDRALAHLEVHDVVHLCLSFGTLRNFLVVK